MSRGVVIAMMMTAGGLASVVALVTGDTNGASLQIWLGCFVVVFSVSTVNHLRDRAPVERPERRSMLQSTSAETNYRPSRLRRQRVLEGLVLRSRDHHRSFTQQLQPQLITLATHYLRVDHGVDIEDRAGTDLVLGDVAWLLDTTDSKRTPTLEQLDTFIERLRPPSHAGAST